MVIRAISLCALNFFISFAVWAQNSDEQKSCAAATARFYKYGNTNSATSEKVIRFKELRDQVVSELNAPTELATCYQNFYNQQLEDQAKYWSERIKSATCAEQCQQEAGRSAAFLENLNGELIKKVQLAERSGAKEIKQKTCPQKPKTAQDLILAKTAICCGNNETNLAADPIAAPVRQIYPSDSLQRCQQRVDQNDKTGVVATSVYCLGNMIGKMLEQLTSNVTSLLKMPFAIYSARQQIKQIFFDSEARARMIEGLQEAAKNWLTQQDSAYSCLNTNEKSQYICKWFGSLMGDYLTGGAFVKMLKFLGTAAKYGAKAAQLAGDVFTGGRVTKFVEKVSEAAPDVAKRVAGAAKSSIAATQKAIKAADVGVVVKPVGAGVATWTQRGLHNWAQALIAQQGTFGFIRNRMTDIKLGIANGMGSTVTTQRIAFAAAGASTAQFSEFLSKNESQQAQKEREETDAKELYLAANKASASGERIDLPILPKEINSRSDQAYVAGISYLSKESDWNLGTRWAVSGTFELATNSNTDEIRDNNFRAQKAFEAYQRQMSEEVEKNQQNISAQKLNQYAISSMVVGDVLKSKETFDVLSSKLHTKTSSEDASEMKNFDNTVSWLRSHGNDRISERIEKFCSLLTEQQRTQITSCGPRRP